MKSTSDPRKHSATYRQLYPKNRIELAPDKIQNHFDSSRIIFNKLPPQTLSEKFFSNSSFIDDNQIQTKISKLTFEKCTFERIMMGSIEYDKVRFRNCKFFNCDFNNSTFENCIFENCNFEACSAKHLDFIKTEIDDSLILNLKNFEIENSNENKLIIKINYYKNLMRISNSAYRSNLELYNNQDANKLINLNKKYCLNYYSIIFFNIYIINILSQLRGSEKSNELIYIEDQKTEVFFRGLLPAFFNWFINLVGNNIAKLTFAGCVSIAISNLILLSTDATYDENHRILIGNISLFLNFIYATKYSLSLFLGFGFTNFSSINKSANLLYVLISTSGLVWYALLIPLIIRKFGK